jgi:hypothetical protein
VGQGHRRRQPQDRVVGNGRIFTAGGSSSGYAHLGFDIDSSSCPRGAVVEVTTSLTHADVTDSAATRFEPNDD